jgi:hypothetical protein
VEGKGVGSKIAIWDTYGLKDQPDFQIPRPAGDLVTLPQPLRIAIRKYHGKSLEPDASGGAISRLSERGARLCSDTRLDPFSSIQISIPSREGDLVLDAKVRSLEDQDLLISFTGVRPEARVRLARLLKQ